LRYFNAQGEKIPTLAEAIAQSMVETEQAAAQAVAAATQQFEQER
jgi:hypothetical protein